MPEDASQPANASRRELLGGALTGIATAGVIAPATARAARASKTAGDAKVLSTLLRVERRLTGAYRRVLAAGLLNVVVDAEVRGFLAQEREHIGALERELSLRGAGLPAPGSPATGRALQTQADALNILVGAETVAQSAYLQAISKLQEPALVRVAAEIMASEAQHGTLLRVLQNPENPAGAVPAAFVAAS